MLVTIFGTLGLLLAAGAIIYLLVLYFRLVKRIQCLVYKNVELQEEYNQRLPSLKREYQQIYETQYRQRVEALRQRMQQDNAHLLSQAICSTAAKSLQASMQETIDKQYKRTTQGFIGDVCDEAEGVVRDLQFGLGEAIWDAFQQYKEKASESPQIIPDNARILYTKGNRTVIIIEQKPQVRTVGFASGLVQTQERPKAKNVTQNAYWFSLSFPYVYFVLVFDSEKYQYVEVYFKNSKISSVKEKLCLAPLPNIHRDKKGWRPMCMGDGFTESVRRAGTVPQQIDKFVATFWQRAFNSHLGNGGYRKIDDRIKKLHVWQEHSQADPLFVLTVPWEETVTVKGLVEEKLDQRKQNHELDPCEKHVRQLLDKGIDKLTTNVKGAIEAARNANAVPNLDQKTKAALEVVLADHVNKVFEHCAKE